MSAHGQSKASPEKRAWAEEVVSKSEGTNLADLPEHSRKASYAGLSKRKRGIRSYSS